MTETLYTALTCAVTGELLEALRSPQPDGAVLEGASEILAALRPGMATVPDALLLGLSSPYAAKGELFKAHERYFGTTDTPVDSVPLEPRPLAAEIEFLREPNSSF